MRNRNHFTTLLIRMESWKTRTITTLSAMIFITAFTTGPLIFLLTDCGPSADIIRHYLPNSLTNHLLKVSHAFPLWDDKVPCQYCPSIDSSWYREWNKKGGQWWDKQKTTKRSAIEINRNNRSQTQRIITDVMTTVQEKITVQKKYHILRNAPRNPSWPFQHS